MGPLVSILIPCFNAGPWIAECVESALNQTYPHKEIIVVDDGSNDNSLEILRTFAGRIHFETGPNRGGNVARNRLIELSRGEWLDFLDADDYLRPQKIERQMALVAQRPQLDVIYSPTREVYPDTGHECVSAVEDDDLYANYIRWANFSTTALLLKKSAVLDVGGWKIDQPVCQEHELILRMILAGKQFALMPEALGVNRIQYVNSVSRRSPIRVIQQRMALTDRLEAHLADRGPLNALHRWALADARFRAARYAYSWDRSFAGELAAKAKTTGSIWRCRELPLHYRCAFQMFGFEFAETMAKWRRKVKQRFARRSHADDVSPANSGTSSG